MSISDFNFNFDFNAALLENTNVAATSTSSFWKDATNMFSDDSDLQNSLGNSSDSATPYPENSTLGYNNMALLAKTLSGGTLPVTPPTITVTANPNNPSVPTITLSSEMTQSQFDAAMKAADPSTANEQAVLTSAYQSYQTKYAMLQDYCTSLTSYLSSGLATEAIVGPASDLVTNLTYMVEIIPDTIFTNDNVTGHWPNAQLNATVMSKVFADVGVNPAQYGVSSDTMQSFLTQLNAGLDQTIGGQFGQGGVGTTVEVAANSAYKNFVNTVTSYIQSTADSGETIDDLLNTYYNDTINPAIVEDSVQINYTDPSHANIPPPDYTYLDQTFGVDLNSSANQALYNSIVQNYASQNNLTASQVQRLEAAHEDPTINDPWAQKTDLQLMATFLGTLAKNGQINITQAMYNKIINPPNAADKLPAAVLSAITELQSEAKAGSAVLNGLSAEQLTAVLGALLIAGQSVVDTAQTTANKVASMGQSEMIAGVLFRGSATVLNKIVHPDALPLVNFLSSVAASVSNFKNEMMEVMISNSEVNQAQNVAKRSAINEQMDQIAQSIQNQNAALQAEQQALAKARSMGIDLMAGGAGMAAVAATLIAMGSLLISLSAITFGITLGPGIAMLSIGIALAAAASALLVEGGLMYAQGEGINIAQQLMNALPNDASRDSIMAVMALITVICAVLTVLTAGASAGLAVAAASGLTAVATVASQIWTYQATVLIEQDLVNSGQSQGDAAKNASIIVGILNAVMILATMGAGASATIARAVTSAVTDATTSVVQAVTSVVKTVGQTLLETSFEDIGESFSTAMKSAVNFVKSGGVIEGVKSAAIAAGGAVSSAAVSTAAAVVAFISQVTKCLVEVVSDMAEDVGSGAAASAAMSGMKGAMASLGKAMASFGKAMTELANVKAWTVEEWVQVINTLSQLTQAVTQAAQSIIQGQAYQRQAAIMEVQAVIEETITLLNMEIKMLDQAMQSVAQDQDSMEELITAMTDDFQTLVQDLMQAVSAITSNQAAPQSAATGGGAPETDEDTKPSTPSKEEPEEAKLDLSDMVLVGAPATIVSTSQQAVSNQEGYESKFMGTTKPQQMTALITLVRTLGLKIAEALQKQNIPPKLAQAIAMKQATAVLKQMSMLSNDEMDFSKDAQDALSQNSLMLTLSFLLAKRGVQMQNFNFPQLMEESPQGGTFNEETLGQLMELMEKLAETDPTFQEMVATLKNLTKKNMSSPMEFSFEILKMFAKALNMGKADLSSLNELFGGGDGLSAPTMGALEGDFGDLVDEYFIRGGGGSGGGSEGYSQV